MEKVFINWIYTKNKNISIYLLLNFIVVVYTVQNTIIKKCG